ncbi:glycosyltransferase family 4 protein [Rhizobium sp. TRM95111]|uniref:glycosyltransferase family 4 protein n=1 Tax=Rhizobium alarense TaxID=2846851 RepID=UPI001F1F4A3D|nr:glycosyltransferase family 4 protein [Rhizobium alarense]MCF3641822.1 glycosyltransferase family 4 protein [Rhizobium alarense]
MNVLGMEGATGLLEGQARTKREFASVTPAKRVAVVASYSPSLINFRLELLKRMVESGHSVVALAPEDDPIVTAQLARIGVEFRRVPMARTGVNPLQDVHTLWALWRTLREIRPDVVIPYTMKPIIYGGIAARLAGVKQRSFLVTGLGHVFSEAAGRSAKGRAVKALSIALYRHALFGADVVFAYNEADADDIRRHRMLDDEHILELVPGSGVDLEHFAYREPRRDKAVFLLVARLLEDKGVVDFVEAARRLKPQFPAAEFRILGHFDPNPSAISREQMDAWVKEGLVTYLGETRDVRPFLADCNVFVLPSYYREGIPRSILEALSTGRAIITTALPGCRDTVVDGVNGYLVPARDPRQLAQAMMHFAENPADAHRMGLRSRDIAESRFDVHEVNKRLMRRFGLT